MNYPYSKSRWKILTAQTTQTTEIASFKASIDTITERLDTIANTPHIVDTPEDLDGVPPKPRIYIAANTTGMDAKTAFREYTDIYQRAQTEDFDTGRGYGKMTAKDTRMLDRFVAQNRPALQQAMQDEGYKHGLFRAAATTLTDIPASFSGYLSSIMRQTPKWGKVWHQFLNPVIRLGTGVGNRVDVPRIGKINRPIASTAWTLSGTGFSPNSQPLTAADDGKIDYESLVRLRAHMNGDLGVIPWPDGCYVLVAHPNAIVDLELELTALSKPITRMNVEEVTNMIKMVNTAITDKISGYRFTVGGFNIFTHENLPPDPAFMTSSTGAAATLRNWYDNIAFGPMAVCECISMAPEVRRDEIRNFGTQDRYIWLMYGKYQAIERGTASTGAGIGQRSQIVKFRSGKA